MFATQLSLGILTILVGIYSFNQSRAEIQINNFKAFYKRPDVIPFPSHNPYTREKEVLGRKLFFDTRLSGSNQMACATCHKPDESWSSRLPKAIGHHGKELPRKTPTIINAAWGSSFFWDGRARTLEEQSLMPIQSKQEMNLPIEELVRKLANIPEYTPLFQKAFPNQPLSPELIAKSLATFERTITSGDSAFDRWIEGDKKAISEKAKNGFLVFNTKANCVTCHSGWNFTNGSFADTGIISTDLGRGKILNDADVNHSFKTPTLRNALLRAPFTHNGSLKTIEEVIENYNHGGSSIRSTTKFFIKPLNLSTSEKEALINFLATITEQTNEIHIKGESWNASINQY